MSLKITTPIELESGIVLNESYGRVSTTDDYRGTTILASLEVFADITAFKTNKKPIRMTNIDPYTNIIYNRDLDGVDILSIAHDALIISLALQGITAVKVLN